MTRFILLAAALSLWLIPCPTAAAEGPRVLVAIAPLAGLVQRLAPEARVEVLLPPGASPHTYEPTPRRLMALSEADLYLGLDLPFERSISAKLGDLNPGLKAVDLSAGITRRRLRVRHGHDGKPAHPDGQADGQAGEPDPHLWLSPRLGMVLAANAARALGEADPARAALYLANLAGLQNELTALDQRLARVLAPLRGREFLVYHPAFGYFADAYGLVQEPVELEGKSPGPRALAAIIERARAEGIRVVFVQPQMPAASARQVAQAIGGVVAPLDPLAPDYLANLERLAQTLEQGLSSAPSR